MKNATPPGQTKPKMPNTLAEKKAAVEALVASFVAAGQRVQNQHAEANGHFRCVLPTRNLADLGVSGLSGPLQYSEFLRIDEYGEPGVDAGWLMAIAVKDGSKVHERSWNFGPHSEFSYDWREVVAE